MRQFGRLFSARGATSFSGSGTIASPYLLDMTPASQSNDFRDAVLALGRTFDDGAGVRITVDALSSSSATISVHFTNGGSGAPICADGTTYNVEAYLGGTDAATEGAWVWEGSGIRFWNGGATGAPVAGVYQRFTSGEPNGGSTHDCMRIVSGGSWRDNSCSSSFRAVCESTP